MLRHRSTRAALIVVGLITASCSEKTALDRENATSGTPRELVREAEAETTEAGAELQPEQDSIAEDCVALVRSTKVVPAQTRGADCPECPAGGTEALSFRHMKTEAVSCSGETCTVVVTIRAVFNPGSGETIAGGLTGWIPPEQRIAYLSGHTPAGEQVYRVQVTYKNRGEGWRAVEFDRAPAE